MRADLLRHLHTVLKTPSPLARYQMPSPRRAVAGDVVLLEAGPDGARHRHAIVLGPTQPEALFAQAEEFYGSARIDSVELATPLTPAIEDHLRARGWRMTEEEPALVLETAPHTLPPRPHGLLVKRALDEATLDDFFAISGPGRQHVPSVEAARDPHVAVLVGYVDGEAVATSRVSGHGEVADLMGVVTRPEHRRRGYGTAMTWAAIEAARAMGASAYLLTATELGYPVYLKMGFVPICTMRTYEPG